MFTRVLVDNFAQFGYVAVGVSTLAEGLSLPFPALLILLMAGAAVAHGALSFWGVAIIAALSYTVGSLIPYLIGRRLVSWSGYAWLDNWLNRSPRGITETRRLMRIHGDKMVALARPFWIGNCISYFAGLNQMPPVRYLLFTFAGIFSWSVVIIYIGRMFSANLAKAVLLITNYSTIFGGVLVALLIGWLAFYLYRQRQH